LWRWFELLSFRSSAEIVGLRRDIAGGANPRDIKFLLAEEIVDRFHGAGVGATQREAFLARFSAGELPTEIPEISVQTVGGKLGLAKLLKESGLVPSAAEAGRMVHQGAVRIDQQKVEDLDREFMAGAVVLVQVGKRRIARVTLL
jgi:tyrosyl-tRNA synthetase